MKKLLSLVLALLECLSVLPALAEDAKVTALKEALAAISYTDEETREMSNNRNMSRYITVDGVLIGRGWDEKIIMTTPETSGSRGKVKLTNSSVLKTGVIATWFCQAGSRVYCYLNPFGEDGRQILSIDPATGETAVVREGEANYLTAWNGLLYFTNEDHRFCSLQPDGTGETVVLDRAVYYPYFLTDSILYFQDDADGERGHVLDLTTGAELTLTEDRTYQTILAGDTLYYLYCNEGETTYHLGRVNLKTLENEKASYCASQMFIENGEIWFADDTHDSLEDAWTRTKDVKGYEDTRLSYVYSNGSFYVRYGWKGGTTAISNMKVLTVGFTGNAAELKIK